MSLSKIYGEGGQEGQEGERQEGEKEERYVRANMMYTLHTHIQPPHHLFHQQQ